MNINKNGENMKKIILFIFTMFVLVLSSCNNNNYSKYCEVLKTYEKYEGELTKINEYQCDYYSNYELDINIRKIASDKSLINNAFEFDSSKIECVISSFIKHNEFIYSVAKNINGTTTYIYKFDLQFELIKYNEISFPKFLSMYSLHDGVYVSILGRNNRYYLNKLDTDLLTYSYDDYEFECDFTNEKNYINYGKDYRSSYIFENKSYFILNSMLFVFENESITQCSNKSVFLVDEINKDSFSFFTYDEKSSSINKINLDEENILVTMDLKDVGQFTSDLFVADGLMFIPSGYIDSNLSTQRLVVNNLFVINRLGEVKVVSSINLNIDVVGFKKVSENEILIETKNENYIFTL